MVEIIQGLQGTLMEWGTMLMNWVSGIIAENRTMVSGAIGSLFLIAIFFAFMNEI